jgi:propanediol dehydratase small subunit
MSRRDHPDSRGGPASAVGAPHTHDVRAFSGRRLDAITVDAVVAGELGPDDVRVHQDTLRRQADIAEQHGNPQLAENLRRAAELTAIPDDELLAIYDALRPRRSTRAQLEAIAARLDAADAPICAALVREALDVYGRRGLLATH